MAWSQRKIEIELKKSYNLTFNMINQKGMATMVITLKR
jgi:hypothetical protein